MQPNNTTKNPIKIQNFNPSTHIIELNELKTQFIEKIKFITRTKNPTYTQNKNFISKLVKKKKNNNNQK